MERIKLKSRSRNQDRTMATTPTENECYILQFDGSAQPNPGSATAAAVLYFPEPRKIFCERGEYLGETTNNQAEYAGLRIGLEMAITAGVQNLIVEGDSQLIIFQVQGKWQVKKAELKPLHTNILELLKKFKYILIRHVKRENNAHADSITQTVQRTKQSFFTKT